MDEIQLHPHKLFVVYDVPGGHKEETWASLGGPWLAWEPFSWASTAPLERLGDLKA